MMIHEITSKVGRHKARKRIGRGEGSGHGETAGRGHKGAGSRAGHKHRHYFEGGQMTFVRRIAKRGFTNVRFRTEFHVVNLKQIEERCDAGDVTIDTLVEVGLARDNKKPLKILGEGELTKKFTITAARFSKSARAKIEGAGGTVNEVARVKWTRALGNKRKAEKAGE